VKTITATDLLGTYRDVVARLQHEATVPTADAASSNFVDLAQSVECGTSIPPKRHLAVPDATTCVACQERLEQARS